MKGIRRLMGIAAVAAATGLHAAGGWEQFHGNSGNNGRAENGPDLRVYNTPRFASPVDGMQQVEFFGPPFPDVPNISGPVVADGRIFCYGALGYVMAFDESSGARLWTMPVAPGAALDSWSSPSVSNGKVYMGTGTYVYCFDAKTGAAVWTYTLDSASGGVADVVNASVTVAEDIGLCFLHTWNVSGKTRLHAIHIADGTQAWTLDVQGQGQGHVAYNPALKFIYTTVGTLQGGWGGRRGGIAAIHAQTGVIAWTSAGSFDSQCYGGIAFDATLNWVVAAGYDFSEYSGILVCNATDGSTISYTGDGVVPAGNFTPTIGADGTIYVGGAEWASFYGIDGPLTAAYNGHTGARLWITEYDWGTYDEPDAYNWGTYNHSLALAEDIGNGQSVVYVPSDLWSWLFREAGCYGMFDAATGELLAKINMKGGNAALANGNLYFINKNAELVAFGPAVPPRAYLSAPDGEASAPLITTAYSGFVYDEKNTVRGTAVLNAKATTRTDRMSGVVTTNWTFSAKVVLQTTTLSFSGRKTGVADSFLAETRPNAMTKAFETLDVALESGRFHGTVSGGRIGGTLYVDGARNVFANKKDEAAQERLDEVRGLYNVVMSDDDGIGGYLSLRAGNLGAVRIAGKLSDGASVSGSARLLKGLNADGWYAIALHRPLYSRKGFIGSLLWLNPGDKLIRVDAPNEWFVDWVCEDPARGTFARELEVFGAYFGDGVNAPLFPLDGMAFSADVPDDLPPPVASLSGGGWVTTVFPWEMPVTPNGLKLSLSRATAPKRVGASYNYSGANPSAAALSYNARTGLFKGSFRLYYDGSDAKGRLRHTTVRVPYSGVMVPYEGALFGSGFGRATISTQRHPISVFVE